MSRPRDEYAQDKVNVATIVVGDRHRRDLGDLDPLVESIGRLGLLQPITVSYSGVLLCGRRRLEAVRRLGWKTVSVWVRFGLDDKALSLMAERDENALRMPLSPLEQQALYAELKDVYAAEAARRQEATRFGGATRAAESATPRDQLDARRQAALIATGTASYTRMEQIGWLRRVAHDYSQPKAVWQAAEEELELVRQGTGVSPAVERVKNTITCAREPAVLATPAQDLSADPDRHEAQRERRRSADTAAISLRRSRRELTSIVREFQEWPLTFDAAALGPTLTKAQWQAFELWADRIAVLRDSLRTARAEAHLADAVIVELRPSRNSADREEVHGRGGPA